MARIRNGNHIIQTVLCLLSLLMLTTLPIQRAHQFQPHYRTTQIRRIFERHSVLAHSDNTTSDRLNTEAPGPAIPVHIEPVSPPLGLRTGCLRPIPISIPNQFVRLKLGPPSSGGQDPLVQLS